MEELIETKDLVSSGALKVIASMYPDTNANPLDADCYSDADIAAWKRDEWQYVGIVVTVTLDGVEIGQSSLWGTEFGSLAETECQPFTMPNHPLPEVTLEALDAAEAWIEQFCGVGSAAESLLTDAQGQFDALGTP
jgi:hypothetical protein